MSVSQKLNEFALYTSCHGVPHIASAKKLPIKLFWAGIVIAAAVLVIIDIRELYMKYKENPKIVQSEIKFEQLPFPAVTVCNLNPIRKSQVHLVPQLEKLLTACDLPIDKSAKNTTYDYCKNAQDSYRVVFPKGSQKVNGKK